MAFKQFWIVSCLVVKKHDMCCRCETKFVDLLPVFAPCSILHVMPFQAQSLMQLHKSCNAKGHNLYVYSTLHVKTKKRHGALPSNKILFFNVSLLSDHM